jgi:Homeodomain
MDSLLPLSLSDLRPPSEPLSDLLSFPSHPQQLLPDHFLSWLHTEVAFPEQFHEHPHLQQLRHTEISSPEQQQPHQNGDFLLSPPPEAVIAVCKVVPGCSDAIPYGDVSNVNDAFELSGNGNSLGDDCIGGNGRVSMALKNSAGDSVGRDGSKASRRIAGNDDQGGLWGSAVMVERVAGVRDGEASFQRFNDHNDLTSLKVVDRLTAIAFGVALEPRNSSEEFILRDGNDGDFSERTGDARTQTAISGVDRSSKDADTIIHKRNEFSSRRAVTPHGPARAPKWVVSSTQRHTLIVEFEAQPYPTLLRKTEIAGRIAATVAQVSKWFQHHRESLGRVNKFKLQFPRTRKTVSDVRGLNGVLGLSILDVNSIPISEPGLTKVLSFAMCVAYFSRKKYPTADDITKLADSLESVSENQIRVWFKHRRKQISFRRAHCSGFPQKTTAPKSSKHGLPHACPSIAKVKLLRPAIA